LTVEPGPLATATTAVERTYYGQPVIKAPHWRWLVIVYFFCGALAGGSFAIGAIADLSGRDQRTVRMARYLSLAALAPSPILLTLDLGRPERFLNMLRIVKLRSPMSLGSWALFLLGPPCALIAGLQLVRDLTGSAWPAALQRGLSLAGLPVALFVAGYTGLLLAITNVPLWARNRLLMAPTFLTSAFSSSFAALSILLLISGPTARVSPAPDRKRTAEDSLARGEMVSLAAELILLTAGIIRRGRLGKPLTTGRVGAIFWPVTYFGGIVIPLALHVVALVGKLELSRRWRLATALQVLAGAFTFRALMIFGGRESAKRPEDYFELTRTEV